VDTQIIGQYPIVLVEWFDAVASSEWTEFNSLHIDTKIPAVGFLVKETDDFLTLAVTHKDGEANAALSIPKAWIRTCKILKT